MTLRKQRTSEKHGAHIAPILEVLPIDELPDGIPAPPVQDRADNGQFLPGNTRAAEGGKAKAGYRRYAARLGLATLPEGAALGAYRGHATEWRDAVAADLARTVGAGVVGPMASSFLDSAAHALMWSRYLGDQAMVTGDPDLAMVAGKHAETSSRLVREAWEYAAREAQ